MVAPATVTPRTSPPAPISIPREPAAVQSPRDPASGVRSPRDPASGVVAQDGFERGSTSGATAAGPAPTGAAPVQGDPELARQARAQLQSAQLGSAPLGTDRAVTPVVRNDPGDLHASQVGARQTAFRSEMQAATGVAPSDPPTEAEVRSYFRALRSRPASEAVAACERYQDAFQRHDGSHDYGSQDTIHATRPDRGQARILAGGAEAAEREHRAGRNTQSVVNDAPDNFAEANADRGTDGRARMDCEGFAVSSSELLREAGFTSRQAVGTFPDGSGHAAAIVSRGGQSWVMSNGDAYRVEGSGNPATRRALDRAFDATIADGVPATYYTGRTQDEAAAREAFGMSAGRIQ